MPCEHSPRLKRGLAMVRLPVALLAALLLMGAGCTAPTQDDPAAAHGPAPVAQAPAAPASAAAPPVMRDARPPRAPPMSDPLPPAEVPAGAPVKIDTACTRDADCTIKDVGNCCGYYPACVNVDSPTDPAGVQARCASEGRMSVCGFPSISACHCVAGECQGDGAAVER